MSQRGRGRYQPAIVHHSPIRTTYSAKGKRPRQSPAKSHDKDSDDVVLVPSTSDEVVKRPKLRPTETKSMSKKEQVQQERAERKKREALVCLLALPWEWGVAYSFLSPSHISILWAILVLGDFFFTPPPPPPPFLLIQKSKYLTLGEAESKWEKEAGEGEEAGWKETTRRDEKSTQKSCFWHE